MTGFRGNWDTGERRSLKRVLIVGAGRAGVAAAEELRRQGFGGEVIVMCDEPEAPYDRPSCSKSLLTGNKRPRDARMPVQEDLAIQWEVGRQAVHLDAGNRVVIADNDQKYPYDGLVIATGADPVWPKEWPKGEPGLHQLYGLRHAWELRKALQRAKRVAVVGGGLTGCEVACSVRKMARQCTLIDSKQQVMARAVGEVAGRYVTEEVANDGVEMRLGRRVKAIERNRRGWVLVLDDSSEVEADVVVATVGDRPDTRWLAGTGIDTSDGVLCDENLRVFGVDDVVAAGTVARWPNLRYSTEPRRVGQWIMALEQGRAAAAALLRSDHPSRPAALIPRYWSDQFGLRIQVCGEVPPDNSAEMTVSRQRPGRRDTARAGVLVGYHRNGEQIGVVGVNALRAFTTTARMMLATPPRLVSQAPALRQLEAAPTAAMPALPPAEPRMIAAAPAYVEAYQEPYQEAPVYYQEAPVYYQEAPAYYEEAPAYYQEQSVYQEAPPYGPAPYGPEPYGPPPYGPVPTSPPVPALPPAPRDRFAAEPPAEPAPYPQPEYGYPPEYGPAMGQEQPVPAGYGYGYGYSPEYGYGPEYAYGPEYGYAPEYAYPQVPPGYEQAPPPPEYMQPPEPGYPPPGYPQYAPPDYGYAQQPPPGYESEYGYPQGPPPPAEYVYGPETGYGPPPVSPGPAPEQPNPRDRFATDEFAAVR